MEQEFRNILNREFSASPLREPNEYTAVSAMTLYWQESDNDGFLREAEMVQRVFEELRYSVQSFAIPSEHSQLALEGEIIRFIMANNRPSTLMIVHYGGHGDKDDDLLHGRQKQSVWAALRQGGPVLDWFEIQPKFKALKADVLLILDCCYSAQAGRSRLAPSRMEVLAACAMGVECPPPGPASFTMALVKELRHAVEKSGSATVAELQAALTRKEARYIATPVHLELAAGSRKPSICLKPLMTVLDIDTLSQPVISSLTLQVSMTDMLNKEILRDVASWLKRDIPSSVSALNVEDVILHAEHLDKLIHGTSEDSSIVDELDSNGRHAIAVAWNSVYQTLEAGKTRSRIMPRAMKKAEIEQEASSFIEELFSKNHAAKKTIERVVLTSPNLAREEVLGRAIQDVRTQRAGLTEPLTLRMIVEHDPGAPLNLRTLPFDLDSTAPSHSASSSEVLSLHERRLGSKRVLVEYKTYGKNDVDRGGVLEMMTRRTQQLAFLLNTATSAEFHSLKCLNWFEDRASSCFGLVFEKPEFASTSFTIRHCIQAKRGSPRPSLGERFQVAWNVGQAIQKWHSIGWVHQNIRSQNIIFFSHSTEENVIPVAKFTMPYLVGFENSRPSDSVSLGTRDAEDFTINVSRHPERQGHPEISYRKEHDLYSFGVLLLEIGAWRVVDDFFPPLKRAELLPSRIQKTLLRQARASLEHYMGKGYSEAACTCLDGAFGVTMDSKSQEALAMAFEERVMKKLSSGLAIR